MKLLMIFVLAGSLFVQPAGSLKCYTCTMQVSNSMCQGVTDCDGNTTACRTDKLSAAGFLTLVTKECSSSCKVAYKDYFMAKRNISCCNADLCNLNGAEGFGTSYTKAGWSVCISFSLTFFRSGL
uniref:prostate stem cell antigen n=1 Tax=Euleptes europaea TaxID=460621 RepID=UPI002541E22A|nr:prostate stem cell antigen [Euleptes europaea]